MIDETGTSQPMEGSSNATDLNLSGNNSRSISDRKHFIQLTQLAQSPNEVVDVIKQVLESSNVYVFGEILAIATVHLLGTPEEPYLRLLSIFAYDTYKDYLRQKEGEPKSLPDLTPTMLIKLRQLSIISLACKTRNVSYAQMMAELDIGSVRELEDLIIESIYSNLIKGIMDQKKGCLEVEETMGRDVRPENLDGINDIFSQWLQNCDKMLANLEHQMTTANRERVEHIAEKKQCEVKQNMLLKQLEAKELDWMPGMQQQNHITSKRSSVKSNLTASPGADANAMRMLNKVSSNRKAKTLRKASGE